MKKYYFLFKINDSGDRIVVNYIEPDRLGKLECGHYFPSINLTGACFSGSLIIKKIGEKIVFINCFNEKQSDFDDITTILSKEEFVALDAYNKAINKLGCGIKEGDDRHLKGLELFKKIKPILEKLKSPDNEALFQKVIAEEREFIKNEHNLDDEEIDEIFNEYSLDYRDRGIVGSIWNNIEEAAHEEAESYGEVKDGNDRFFNYEEFGKALLEGDSYIELSSGKVVRLMY